jgi:hypothetical protein
MKLIMYSANWFRNTPQPPSSPRLRELLRQVLFYLKSKPDENEVVPKFVAKAINESEVSVFTALRFLERAGVVEPWFGVFCKATDVPLGMFPTLEKIPKELRCDVCDEQHFRDQSYKVEIVYRINRDKLEGFDPQAFAA